MNRIRLGPWRNSLATNNKPCDKSLGNSKREAQKTPWEVREDFIEKISAKSSLKAGGGPEGHERILTFGELQIV